MRISRVIAAALLTLVLPLKMCLAAELDAQQLLELQVGALDVVLCPVQKVRGCSVINPATPERCPRQFCNVVVCTVKKKKICRWNCQVRSEALPDLGKVFEEPSGKDCR